MMPLLQGQTHASLSRMVFRIKVFTIKRDHAWAYRVSLTARFNDNDNYVNTDYWGKRVE